MHDVILDAGLKISRKKNNAEERKETATASILFLGRKKLYHCHFKKKLSKIVSFDN